MRSCIKNMVNSTLQGFMSWAPASSSTTWYRLLSCMQPASSISRSTQYDQYAKIPPKNKRKHKLSTCIMLADDTSPSVRITPYIAFRRAWSPVPSSQSHCTVWWCSKNEKPLWLSI
jgi:hypothetical protein